MPNINLKTVLETQPNPSDSLYRKTFIVKDYQRGYRWSKSQIVCLLEDVRNFDTQNDKLKYCMQPLVVKKETCPLSNSANSLSNMLSHSSDAALSDVWELIDGQQRLTTILLILKECYSARTSANSLPYDIIYANKREIDDYYIQQAQKYIKEWFENLGNEKDDALDDMRKALSRQIQFIWYEVDTNVNSNEIFTKLNMGKVPLTNAELFKALLLGQKTPGCEEELAKIAFEWDRIEQSLHDNDFWYFISNTACGAETRIDYLLRLYVAHFTQDVPEKNDELYPFLTINDRINKKKKNSPDKDKAAFDECREIWEDIVSLFDKLSEWYRDNDLYHQIGFLIAYETPGKDRNKDSINVIDDLIRSTDGCRKSECNKAILNKIRQNFKAVKIDDLEYETSSKDRLKIKNVLLCFNIFTMIESKAKTRFSFNQYKSQMWDVEHVHARATESELNSIGQEKEIELLKALAEQIGRIGDIARQGDAQDNIDKIEKYIQVIDSPSVPFVDFYNEINDYYDNCSGNGIGNLVLLDAKTNRSYHNALFAEKRQKIIDRDKGGVFIPVCTRNVFLKVYSGKEGLGNMFQWTSKDAEKYVEEIKRVFGEAKII